LAPSNEATQGLRERKKAKTRSAIQTLALRLFREQGYDATTVQQIIEEADVSESTFFRYFPTKADVVLFDDFDPVIVEAFRRQPKELSAISAFRRAFSDSFRQLSTQDAGRSDGPDASLSLGSRTAFGNTGPAGGHDGLAGG